MVRRTINTKYMKEELNYKDDPRYVCRVNTVSYEVVRNNTKIIRTKNKLRYSPSNKRLESATAPSIMNTTGHFNARGTMSPYSKARRNGKSKQIRPEVIVLGQLKESVREGVKKVEWGKVKGNVVLTGIARVKQHVVKIYNHGQRKLQIIHPPYENITPEDTNQKSEG